MSRTCLAGILAAALLALLPATAGAQSMIDCLRIDAHGRVSGVILMNGTEIVLPFDRAAQLVRSVRHGETLEYVVAASGLREWLADHTHVMTQDSAPAPTARGGGPGGGSLGGPGSDPLLDDLRALAVQHVWGRVALMLHTTAGRLSGFVMDSGAQVHVVPRVSLALDALRVGEWVEVTGRGTRDEFGTALWALRVRRIDRSVLFDLERTIGAPELALANP